MKTLPPGLQDHLNSGATALAWCWRLERRDGVVMGFTDHDEKIDFASVSYEALSGFTATEIRSSLGLSVDNLDVEGALSSDRIRERDISAGLYDDAGVEIWRVNWRNPDQRVLMRKGNLGEISRGETSFRAEVRGLAHQLQQPQGRIFQRVCDADLGDVRCGVDTNDPAFRATIIVTGLSGAQTLTASGLSSFADGWFDRGILTFTSGNNDGLSYAVRSQRKSGGTDTISTWTPVAFDMAINDTATLVAGCDKRIETCKSKFANAVNFRGFPHMPGNDFVMQYPKRGDENLDGSERFDAF